MNHFWIESSETYLAKEDVFCSWKQWQIFYILAKKKKKKALLWVLYFLHCQVYLLCWGWEILILLLFKKGCTRAFPVEWLHCPKDKFSVCPHWRLMPICSRNLALAFCNVQLYYWLRSSAFYQGRKKSDDLVSN